MSKLEKNKASFKPKESKTPNASIATSKVIKFKRPTNESSEYVEPLDEKVMSRVSSNAAIPVEQAKVQFVKDLYHATG